MNRQKDEEMSTALKLEERVRQRAVELKRLLDRAPMQHCRAEGAWNEGDDFTDRFADIWGEQVG
jgi:hypothetical protein